MKLDYTSCIEKSEEKPVKYVKITTQHSWQVCSCIVKYYHPIL